MASRHSEAGDGNGKGGLRAIESPDSDIPNRRSRSFSASSVSSRSDTNLSGTLVQRPLKLVPQEDPLLHIASSLEDTQKLPENDSEEISHMKRTIYAALHYNATSGVKLDEQLQDYEEEVGQAVELRKVFIEVNLQMLQAEQCCADSTNDMNILGNKIEEFQLYVTNFSKKLIRLRELINEKQDKAARLEALNTLFARIPKLEKQLKNVPKCLNQEEKSFTEDDKHRSSDDDQEQDYNVYSDQSNEYLESAVRKSHSTDNLNVGSGYKQALNNKVSVNTVKSEEQGPTFTCAWAYPPTQGSKRVERCGKTFYTLTGLRRHKKGLDFSGKNSHFYFNCVQKKILKLDHTCGIRLVQGGECEGITKQDKFAIRKHYGEAAHVIDFSLNNLYCFVCKHQFIDKKGFLEHLSQNYNCFHRLSEKESSAESSNFGTSTSAAAANSVSKSKLKNIFQEFKELAVKKGPGKALESEKLFQKAIKELDLDDDDQEDAHPSQEDSDC